MLNKKMIINVLAILTFFIFIEVGARCYHYLKYRDPAVFLYGKKFFANLIMEIKQPKRDAPKDILTSGNAADDIFEKRHSRNVPLVLRTPGKELLLGYMAYINKYGLRNRDIELKKGPKVARLLAAGESFVACPGVPDELTWEYLLQEMLNRPQMKYEVINAGGGGNYIDDTLVELIDKYIKFSPDYVLVFSAHNDRNALKGERKTSLKYRISNFFYNVSQFYAMVREKSSLLLFKDNNYYLYDYNIGVKEEDVEAALKIYRKRLGQIHTVCRENNARLIMGLQPEFIPYGLKDLRNPMDEKKIAGLGEVIKKMGRLSYYEFEYYMQGRFNLEMKKFAQENNILLFDGVSIFPEDKYPYFSDEIHLNKNGTSLFAKSLYEFLINNGIAGTGQA